MLKSALEPYKDEKDLVLLFTDAYDVIINGKEDELFDRFDHLAHKEQTYGNTNGEMRVLISAEDLIWPDRSVVGNFGQNSSFSFSHPSIFLENV